MFLLSQNDSFELTNETQAAIFEELLIAMNPTKYYITIPAEEDIEEGGKPCIILAADTISLEKCIDKISLIGGDIWALPPSISV